METNSINGSQEDISEKNEKQAVGDHDEADVFGSSFYKDTKKKAVAAMPVDKHAKFYNMDHKHRGIAVILNHESFASHMNLKARAGTKVDKENLEKTLKKLGFDVHLYDDKKVQEIDEIIEKASSVDHSNNDCFLLACLSHGEQGILYASDAPYKPEKLWNRFTADKCTSLAGKPKLFFIQACQGDKLDAGVTLKQTQVDSSPSYTIPAHADFIIAYSTIPGFYSWRNTMRGSWFMQALCEELNANGYKEDLLTLLTTVNRKVAIDYESNVPDNSVMHAQKQIPCITFMLTRILKFQMKNEIINV
ncbi:caspase-1-like isoform X2 [Macrosteles quadrilineatus]|uniref:caspase-1-like isoform X2 n=1 Tax=Macrosteles quadrilineatus TaxID=74068 RepID=UPI0023E0A568|nr:caspase-1-like isoform X2 [Macrosteles quadrilineatus]